MYYKQIGPYYYFKHLIFIQTHIHIYPFLCFPLLPVSSAFYLKYFYFCHTFCASFREKMGQILSIFYRECLHFTSTMKDHFWQIQNSRLTFNLFHLFIILQYYGFIVFIKKSVVSLTAMPLKSPLFFPLVAFVFTVFSVHSYLSIFFGVVPFGKYRAQSLLSVLESQKPLHFKYCF